MYNKTLCNYFTAKAPVNKYKVEKSENLDNAFYVFVWQKRKNSRFGILVGLKIKQRRGEISDGQNLQILFFYQFISRKIMSWFVALVRFLKVH